MKKTWYVNDGGRNLGPFTTTDILEHFEQGKIKPFTLCWKQGMKEWKPFFSLEKTMLQSLEISNGPSVELPKIPDSSELPEIPSQVTTKKTSSFLESKLIGRLADDELDIDMDKNRFPLFSSIGAAAIVSLIIVSTFIFISTKSERELIFKNVSLDVLRSLESSKDNSKFYVSLGLDKSGEVIFAKTNINSKALLSAKFSLVDGLSEDSVSFSSSAISKTGSVKFDEFSFFKGDQIVQGKYKVDVKANIDDTFTLIKHYLLGRQTQYVYTDEVYLVPGTIDEYKTKLKEIKYNKIAKKKEELSSLKQKLQTIDSIVVSMALHYRVALKKRSGHLSSKEFKKRYFANTGPLLQNIIIADHGKLKSSNGTQLVAPRVEASILELSKQVSAWSVELSSKLAKYGRLNSSKRTKLTEFMNSKRDTIAQQISLLQKEIEQKGQAL